MNNDMPGFPMDVSEEMLKEFAELTEHQLTYPLVTKEEIFEALKTTIPFNGFEFHMEKGCFKASENILRDLSGSRQLEKLADQGLLALVLYKGVFIFKIIQDDPKSIQQNFENIMNTGCVVMIIDGTEKYLLLNSVCDSIKTDEDVEIEIDKLP